MENIFKKKALVIIAFLVSLFSLVIFSGMMRQTVLAEKVSQVQNDGTKADSGKQNSSDAESNILQQNQKAGLNNQDPEQGGENQNQESNSKDDSKSSSKSKANDTESVIEKELEDEKVSVPKTNNGKSDAAVKFASEFQGRDISDHITSIDIVNSDTKNAEDAYDDGVRLGVKGTFDDSKGKIKENDFIKITWPSDEKLNAYVKGFNGSKDLNIDGKNVGNYQVNTKEAILTFNKNIETFTKEVHGDFSFEVTARNLSKQDQTIPFSSGNTVKIITEKGQTSGTSEGLNHKEWRGSKVGDLRSDDKTGKNYIMWGVYLNSDAAYLDDDIVVDDPIGDGMNLKQSSVYFYIDDQNYNLNEFKSAFPTSTLTTDNNELHLDLDKNYFSGRQVMMGYITSLTDDSLPYYENTATVTYRLHGENSATTVNESKTVENASFDAHVYGTIPHELKIVKMYKDDDGSIKTPEDVEFEISDGKGWSQVYTTDKNGIIDIKNLDAGKYIIKEIKAPDFLEVSDKTWEYVVFENQSGKALPVFDKKKSFIPWTPLIPSKIEIPWKSLTPAKHVIPMVPLIPAKKSTEDVVPMRPLIPASKVEDHKDHHEEHHEETKVDIPNDEIPTKEETAGTVINMDEDFYPAESEDDDSKIDEFHPLEKTKKNKTNTFKPLTKDNLVKTKTKVNHFKPLNKSKFVKTNNVKTSSTHKVTIHYDHVSSKINTNEGKNKATLPETGAESSFAIVIFGLIFTALSGAILLRKNN